MATIPTKPSVDVSTPLTAASVPSWPRGQSPASSVFSAHPEGNGSGNGHSSQDQPSKDDAADKPSQLDAFQALLAFSALHEQVRRRKALASRHQGFDAGAPLVEFDHDEQFVLDEVLQLVAERAVAITGADGMAIALAENDEIVLRASAGTVRPDVGARIDRDSAFSGASFRTAQIVNCDDTETDPRVNVEACRRLGARSMVAVPLCGRRRVIGLLEAFSSWPFGFNDSDVRNLSLLAELVVSALKPEDEDRFANSAEMAATKLETPPPPAVIATPVVAQPVAPPTPRDVAPPVPPVVARPITPVVVAPLPTRVEAPAAATAANPAEAPVPAAPTPLTAKPSLVAAAPIRSSPAPATTIPVTPRPKAANLPEFEPVVSAETAPKPVLTFGQEPEAAPRKSSALLLLICVVIAAAFGAGVWWKWKTAQLGDQMVTEGSVSQSDSAATAPGTTSPNAAGSVNPADVPDAISDATESQSTPATPAEMAKFPHITGIRHWSSADASTVVLDLEDQVQYEAHRLAGPDRIYFDLHDTQLASELGGKSIEVGDALLNRVRVAQPVNGLTRVVLETRGSSNFSVSLDPNPYRLIVEVRKIGANSKGAVNLFPSAGTERNRLAIVVPPPTKEDLQLRARVPKMRIVVDAGHGGWDLGTVGRRGLLEKDLVLEIAERLGKLLETRLGMEVIYTRQDDNYIPLDERAEIANHAQADLFVSVHANYSDLPSARGVETYYTNSFSAPGSKEAGAKDVDAHGNTAPKSAVMPALSSADLRERIEQSRHLAASVQRSLYGTLAMQNPGLRDRGIKEAGFVVLTESAMPGILAEVSFVSSPTDEQKLRSDGYREQIAEALYKGIARYAVSSKGVKVASAAK
jgi:N-acetylmuramoyl-L-alanine amidase/putative methionine-R-sulfoxide reductase with GAF domain